MSGKLRLFHLASLHFVGKVWKSLRYTYPLKIAVSTIYKLPALVVVQRQSYLYEIVDTNGNHITCVDFTALIYVIQFMRYRSAFHTGISK